MQSKFQSTVHLGVGGYANMNTACINVLCVCVFCSISGAAATAVTLLLDVLKTRYQVST